MMCNRLAFIWLFFCVAPCFALEWFFDKPRELNAMLADPREAQARVGYLISGNRKSYLDLGFGGYLGLVRQTTETETFPGRLSLGVKGLITSRFAFNASSFDYQNGDMLGGLSLISKFKIDAMELLYFHQSSHLGADSLQHTGRSNTVFSYETVRLLHSHHFNERLRTYEGMEMKVRANPSRLAGELTGVLGGDWHFLSSYPELFAAMDLHFKGENKWAPNSTLVLGYELGDQSLVQRRQRIFLEFFNGYSNQGQFSDERECYVFAGLGFTL